MLSGCPPTQMNFMPLHGRAEAEELHKDHVWWFQTNSKNGSKVLDNSNMKNSEAAGADKDKADLVHAMKACGELEV
jgi:hypothetical protein